MYTSTRSKMNVNASKAIIDGIAPDGGLFVKKLEKTPQIFEWLLL